MVNRAPAATGLALVCALLACAGGEGGAGDPGVLGGSGRAEDGSATDDGSGEDASPGATGSADGSADGTAASDSGASAATSDGAGDAASSSGPGESCGDGIVDLGEQCDDGNDSDHDGCTIWCSIPTCTDGLWSGLETDVDCGGPCQACDICGGCVGDDDCAPGTYCGDAAACTVSAELTVDYLANCGMGNENSVVASGLPDGTYRATALPSAGSVWTPPHDPPATGWMWIIHCTDQSFQQLRTPAGMYYASADEAFANLVAGSEEIEIVGGQLECYRSDSNCEDNVGEVSMAIERVCP